MVEQKILIALFNFCLMFLCSFNDNILSHRRLGVLFYDEKKNCLKKYLFNYVPTYNFFPYNFILAKKNNIIMG